MLARCLLPKKPQRISLFPSSSCQLAPCCLVSCVQVVMTCRGWSQAVCLSLATDPYSLTMALRETNHRGAAAAVNWKLHRWVFFLLLIETHPSCCQVSVFQKAMRYEVVIFLTAFFVVRLSFFLCSHNKAMWGHWEGMKGTFYLACLLWQT